MLFQYLQNNVHNFKLNNLILIIYFENFVRKAKGFLDVNIGNISNGHYKTAVGFINSFGTDQKFKNSLISNPKSSDFMTKLYNDINNRIKNLMC